MFSRISPRNYFRKNRKKIIKENILLFGDNHMSCEPPLLSVGRPPCRASCCLCCCLFYCATSHFYVSTKLCLALQKLHSVYSRNFHGKNWNIPDLLLKKAQNFVSFMIRVKTLTIPRSACKLKENNCVNDSFNLLNRCASPNIDCCELNLSNVSLHSLVKSLSNWQPNIEPRANVTY